MPETPSKLKRPDQFFEKATKSNLIEEVKKEVREAQTGLLDQGQLREQEDWSFLASKIVGSEGE